MTASIYDLVLLSFECYLFIIIFSLLRTPSRGGSNFHLILITLWVQHSFLLPVLFFSVPVFNMKVLTKVIRRPLGSPPALKYSSHYQVSLQQHHFIKITALGKPVLAVLSALLYKAVSSLAFHDNSVHSNSVFWSDLSGNFGKYTAAQMFK